MNRFFLEPAQIAGTNAFITGEDVKHIGKVLRLDIGDEVMLCDGAGMDYLARIEDVQKDVVQLAILQSIPSITEPAHVVTLYQGLPKAGKMELIIQKCVELGLYSLVPVAALRSIVKTNIKEFESKRIRYQRVAYEAAKQARRGIIPQITELSSSFQEADMRQHDLLLIADEEERSSSLKTVLLAHPGALNIGLVIGPEGGLERSEIDALKKKGGICLTIGPRILRTETAGMAALAMILYELGDMA